MASDCEPSDFVKSLRFSFRKEFKNGRNQPRDSTSRNRNGDEPCYFYQRWIAKEKAREGHGLMSKSARYALRYYHGAVALPDRTNARTFVLPTKTHTVRQCRSSGASCEVVPGSRIAADHDPAGGCGCLASGDELASSGLPTETLPMAISSSWLLFFSCLI